MVPTSRRQLPPSKWLFDFLHIYYTAGGCAAVEMAKIVHLAVHRLEQSTDSLAALLELPWKVPSHVLGLSSPRSRRRLLETARLPDKSYKGKSGPHEAATANGPLFAGTLRRRQPAGNALSKFRSLAKDSLGAQQPQATRSCLGHNETAAVTAGAPWAVPRCLW